jgi:phosphate acetyltransferase
MSSTLTKQRAVLERDPHRHEIFERLLERAKSLPKLSVAVAHPCDQVSLGAALEAASIGLIDPILVGPRHKIAACASSLKADLSSFSIIDAEHSHDAAEKAVECVRAERAEALMKGSLHTDELMAAVGSRQSGLRTARRIGHCFVMDVPGHPTPLIVTDAAINIAPTLNEKRDIVQNAIDLAHALTDAEVKVAILSAMETVNANVPSTVEAAALCKMADRGQIVGAASRLARRPRTIRGPQGSATTRRAALVGTRTPLPLGSHPGLFGWRRRSAALARGRDRQSWPLPTAAAGLGRGRL